MSKHKNKNQNVNNETVNNETTEIVEEEVEMTEKKESVFTKIGSGVKKVVTSKPAKVVGTIVLTAGAVGLGYLAGKKGIPSSDNGDNFDGYIDATETLDEVSEAADVTEEN